MPTTGFINRCITCTVLLAIAVSSGDLKPTSSDHIRYTVDSVVKRGSALEYQRVPVSWGAYRSKHELITNLLPKDIVDMDISDIKTSADHKWVAVGLIGKGFSRALLVLRAADSTVVFAKSEQLEYSHWFDWDGGSRLYFHQDAENSKNVQLYHVFAIRPPHWGEKVETITKRAVVMPKFVRRIVRRHDTAARDLMKILTKMKLHVPVLSAPTGTEGLQVSGWYPYLIDSTGKWGSISDDRKFATILVRDKEAPKHLTVYMLQRRDSNWSALPLRVLGSDESTWAMTVVDGTVFLGISKVLNHRPKTAMRTLEAYHSDTSQRILQIESDAFTVFPEE